MTNPKAPLSQKNSQNKGQKDTRKEAIVIKTTQYFRQIAKEILRNPPPIPQSDLEHYLTSALENWDAQKSHTKRFLDWLPYLLPYPPARWALQGGATLNQFIIQLTVIIEIVSPGLSNDAFIHHASEITKKLLDSKQLNASAKDVPWFSLILLGITPKALSGIAKTGFFNNRRMLHKALQKVLPSQAQNEIKTHIHSLTLPYLIQRIEEHFSG